jgi:hypothetical protein
MYVFQFQELVWFLFPSRSLDQHVRRSRTTRAVVSMAEDHPIADMQLTVPDKLGAPARRRSHLQGFGLKALVAKTRGDSLT